MSRDCLGVSASVKGRRWELRHDPEGLEAYCRTTGLDPLTASLLSGRNVTPDEVEVFLAPTLRNSLPNPSDFQDADRAAEIILDAIAADQKITLFSDYDVDGGSSAAQLIRWGRGLDYEFGLYVPDRVKEGYGPSTDAFDQLKAEGVDLVITLDCGAAAQTALEHAATIGLPVVVIDHHQMGATPPPARAIVNPNRQDDRSGQGHLAAAGVVFILIVALQRAARARGLETRVDPKSLLGLTALGTICDVVPLRGVNRAIVRQGMKVLSADKNIGVQALADVANVVPPYTPYHAGFVLGPRINAGGRIGRADMGARLLSTEDAQAAYGFAAELDRVNATRRQMQDRILTEALDAAQAHAEDPVIIVAMEDWHPGIIGIVAGRLKDRFGKPAIVIGIDHDAPKPVAKGSGRSITGVDLGQAVTGAREAGLLTSGGGHAMAAGLSLAPENLQAFQTYMIETLTQDVAAALQDRATKVDHVLDLAAATPAMLEKVERVGPYGAGNPRPLFAFANVAVTFAKRTRGDHVRFTLADDSGRSISGICFRAGESGLDEVLLNAGARRFHALGQLKSNVWNGRTTIDFQLSDLAETVA